MDSQTLEPNEVKLLAGLYCIMSDEMQSSRLANARRDCGTDWLFIPLCLQWHGHASGGLMDVGRYDM